MAIFKSQIQNIDFWALWATFPIKEFYQLYFAWNIKIVLSSPNESAGPIYDRSGPELAHGPYFVIPDLKFLTKIKANILFFKLQ